MGEAWTSATAMIGANRDLVLTIAGLFFFLPQFALALFAPEAVNPAPPPPASDPSDMQAVIDASLAAATEQYSEYWWAFLGITLLQTVGTLTLLTLLTDREKPTVGQAIKLGIRGLLPYFGALILIVIAAAILIGLPLGVLSAAGLGVVAVLIAIPVLIYVSVKFSLYTAVIAIEQEYNPIKALQRSWQLTKGNSLMLFVFLLLLAIVIGILALLVTLATGVIFAAIGGTVEQAGVGFFSSIVNAVAAIVFLAVFAAVHQQFSGKSGTGAEVTDVFE